MAHKRLQPILQKLHEHLNDLEITLNVTILFYCKEEHSNIYLNSNSLFLFVEMKF